MVIYFENKCFLGTLFVCILLVLSSVAMFAPSRAGRITANDPYTFRPSRRWKAQGKRKQRPSEYVAHLFSTYAVTSCAAMSSMVSIDILWRKNYTPFTFSTINLSRIHIRANAIYLYYVRVGIVAQNL